MTFFYRKIQYIVDENGKGYLEGIVKKYYVFQRSFVSLHNSSVMLETMLFNSVQLSTYLWKSFGKGILIV